MATQISEEMFPQEVEQANGWVLLDFYADWCGPCKMLLPILEELEKIRPNLKIGKINVDQAPNLAQKYTVMSIPTLILFHAGKPHTTWNGLRPKAILLQEIDRAMGV